jgi:formate dehydrogenase subunit gamma
MTFRIRQPAKFRKWTYANNSGISSFQIEAARSGQRGSKVMSAAVSLQEIVELAIDSHREQIGPLLPVLHAIQDKLGHVPADAVPMIASALHLSRAEVHGVISFYHDFRMEPPGEHIVHLCRAEACQAVGARELESHARERLGVEFGETTADGLVTLEAVYCLGNCACSPSIRINDEIHARVSPAKFDELIARLEAAE